MSISRSGLDWAQWIRLHLKSPFQGLSSHVYQPCPHVCELGIGQRHLTFKTFCALILDAWQLTGSDPDSPKTTVFEVCHRFWSPRHFHSSPRPTSILTFDSARDPARRKNDAEPARDEGKQIKNSNMATSIRIRLWGQTATIYCSSFWWR